MPRGAVTSRLKSSGILPAAILGRGGGLGKPATGPIGFSPAAILRAGNSAAGPTGFSPAAILRAGNSAAGPTGFSPAAILGRVGGLGNSAAVPTGLHPATRGYQPESSSRKVPLSPIDPATPNPGLSKVAGSAATGSLNTASNEIETRNGPSAAETAERVSLPELKEYSEGFP